MAKHPIITAEECRQLLDYDPQTGVFTWKVDRRGGARAGQMAGTRTMYGYNQICINCRAYRGARLAWLWMTGEWPRRLVDHINGRKDDDRWSNLRPATDAQNNANKGLGRNNTSGHKGVCYIERDKKWRALWGGKRGDPKGSVFLGYHDTAEEAAEAYQAFVRERYGEFAR